MKLTPSHAHVIAEWLARVTPRGKAEEDALASTVHALRAFVEEDRVATARRIMRGEVR